MERVRHLLLACVVILIIGSIVYIEQKKPPTPKSQGEFSPQGIVTDPAPADPNREVFERKEKQFPRAQELASTHGFINTAPFTIKDLIGKKVVLVDFWTYSCINCQRTLPYLNAWYEKYRNEGLEIVAVHTPEFGFEKEYENVARAVKQFGIQYPVVLDNDYGTWRAYENQYWPHKYLVDIDGFIVYDHIGEGSYGETESKIQELLKERKDRMKMATDISTGTVAPAEAEVVGGFAQTPEIYFGSSRNAYLGNGTKGRPQESTFLLPATFVQNLFYLDGSWAITGEYAQNKTKGARIILPYQAAKVFMVAGADAPVTVRVLRDGKPIGIAGGASVKNGEVRIQEETLYRLVEDPTGYGAHTLELIIEGEGLRAFTFTFG